ncbi:MAG: GIY-YIG nuclease family protein [Paracoccus sp. (in: a-proteobacteria)]|uniref:GIY-YIG nuclease family protein n=1 Tax=Paracoccus sp. TaxID=267 RepID=UPI003241D01D
MGIKGKQLRTVRGSFDLSRTVIVGSPTNPNIVYGYRFPSHPRRIKIGYSSRGLSRVAEQATAFPEKPIIEFVIHDRRARTIEGAFHRALRGRQADTIGTEWFDASWGDVLAVSPVLRKASVAYNIVLGGKIIGAALLGLAGLMFYPLLLAMIAALLRGAAMAPLWDFGRDYLEGVIARPPSDSLAMARYLLRQAAIRDVPGLVHLVALMPVPLLAWLPFARVRPQAF